MKGQRALQHIRAQRDEDKKEAETMHGLKEECRAYMKDSGKAMMRTGEPR